MGAFDKIRSIIDSFGKKVVDTPLANNVVGHITGNRLFKLVYSHFEKIHAHKILQEIRLFPTPQHIAIIMDGNRRFARSKGIDSVEGHKIGGKKLKEVLEWCHEIDIKVLTVYAFSTENFNRSKNETEPLMSLFEDNFLKLINEKRIHENKIRVRVIGQLSLLPEKVQKAAQDAMDATKGYGNYSFNLAIGYGGREEIVQAMKKIAGDVKNNRLDIENINPEIMSMYLYTSDIPDPDLVLRTSGEERISNFLLWQLAYSELYFSDVFWPAFKKTDFLKAIRSYQKRRRRYGS